MGAGIRAFAFGIALAIFGAPIDAQTADVPFGGLAHDSSLPVEITADTLNVDQSNAKATFLGNVIVGQGTLRLGAERIDVIYGAAGQTGTVETMTASGKVTLSNGSEAAESARAIYTVADGSVVMEGDVLLSQGQNAISGQRLRIDLNAGTARMEGRVKTIFQPGTSQ